MNLNPLLYPTVLLAAVLFWLGLVAARRVGVSALLVGAAAAVPGALYALYYLHWFDQAAWFYQFRSLPYTELLAAGLGFHAGTLSGWLWRRGGPLRFLAPAWTVGVCVLLGLPYLKSVLAPLDTSHMEDRWQGEVCLQTTTSTCGPACAATLLRGMGKQGTERELAQECYSTSTGTENWYLARALRRRGLRVRFVVLPPNPEAPPYPSIAGLGQNAIGGHFVTVLARANQGYVIGDPNRYRGRRLVPPDQLPTLGFSGFFLVAGER